MDFSHLFQNAQTPPNPVPDGFALVPLHLFLLLAHQLPKMPVPMTIATVPAPAWNNGIYQRALAASAN